MLILLAHGSPDPDWRRSLHALAEAVRARHPAEEVGVAFMQFNGPTLPEVVEDAVRSGQKTLRLLPLFMATAGHVDKDIKPLVAELDQLHTEVRFVLLTPVGEDSLFPGLIADIAAGNRSGL
jgi:sirohydrochlorin cobaltochelatase